MRRFTPILLMLMLILVGCSSPARTAAGTVIPRGSSISAPDQNPSSVTGANPAAERKTVSYGGISLAVPTGWPVIDGAHAPACGHPFASRAQVFVGSLLAVPSCPVSVGHEDPADGVWLTGEPIAPSGASLYVTPTGVYLLAESRNPPIAVYWIHGVSIQLGQGRNPAIATAILSSVRITASAPDSRVAGYCPRDSALDMPTPQRLAALLNLNHGDIRLRPPLAGDQPKVAAAMVWRAQGGAQPGYSYRLLLARYFSTYPATLNPGDGSTTPINAGQLAWIIYQVPTATDVGDCGTYGISAFDAHTGAALGGMGYEPGP